MALTMTRTRTQTALTKLVERLSNVKGELEYVNGLVVARPELAAALLGRRRLLWSQHDALCTTLRQFDEGLDLEQVAVGVGWRKAFRVRTEGSLARRYLAAASASGS